MSTPAYAPSQPLHRWRTAGRAELDALAAARRAVAGGGPARRLAAQQVTHAMVVQLAAQFQRYCRDLHMQCALAVVTSSPETLRPMLAEALSAGAKLSAHSAQPASIGSDFARFDISLWTDADSLDPRCAENRRRLAQVSTWRNAIAHQDMRRPAQDALTAGTRVDAPTVLVWRRALDQLAGVLDRAMWAHLLRIVGSPPW